MGKYALGAAVVAIVGRLVVCYKERQTKIKIALQEELQKVVTSCKKWVDNSPNNDWKKLIDRCQQLSLSSGAIGEEHEKRRGLISSREAEYRKCCADAQAIKDGAFKAAIHAMVQSQTYFPSLHKDVATKWDHASQELTKVKDDCMQGQTQEKQQADALHKEVEEKFKQFKPDEASNADLVTLNEWISEKQELLHTQQRAAKEQIRSKYLKVTEIVENAKDFGNILEFDVSEFSELVQKNQRHIDLQKRRIAAESAIGGLRAMLEEYRKQNEVLGRTVEMHFGSVHAQLGSLRAQISGHQRSSHYHQRELGELDEVVAAEESQYGEGKGMLFDRDTVSRSNAYSIACFDEVRNIVSEIIFSLNNGDGSSSISHWATNPSQIEGNCHS